MLYASGLNQETMPVPTPEEVPVVLTVAGSDSGGGAGLQADLQTFAALGTFGTCAVTCVTAQTPNAVGDVVALTPAIVRSQIRAVCGAFPVRAAKTGMLYSREIIETVAAADVRQGIPILVVDPVMVSASGARLLKADAVEALCSTLLHEARVVTPNLHECEILCGHAITSVADLRQAAREIGDHYDVACVAKGGHLPGPEVVDILYDEGEEHIYAAPRITDTDTHGAGCAFSAALTAYLARRELMKDAVGKAKDYVLKAMRNARPAGPFRPLFFLA
jgi:hydroxymethylpyrimidine/phosphomethylpyrimidine kinase